MEKKYQKEIEIAVESVRPAVRSAVEDIVGAKTIPERMDSVSAVLVFDPVLYGKYEAGIRDILLAGKVFNDLFMDAFDHAFGSFQLSEAEIKEWDDQIYETKAGGTVQIASGLWDTDKLRARQAAFFFEGKDLLEQAEIINSLADASNKFLHGCAAEKYEAREVIGKFFSSREEESVSRIAQGIHTSAVLVSDQFRKPFAFLLSALASPAREEMGAIIHADIENCLSRKIERLDNLLEGWEIRPAAELERLLEKREAKARDERKGNGMNVAEAQQFIGKARPEKVRSAVRELADAFGNAAAKQIALNSGSMSLIRAVLRD